jgi:hypothetical protein
LDSPSLFTYVTFWLLAVGFILGAVLSWRETSMSKRIGGILLFGFFLVILWTSYWSDFYSVDRSGDGIQVQYYMPFRSTLVRFENYDGSELKYRVRGRGVHRHSVNIYLKDGETLTSSEMSSEQAQYLHRKISAAAK